MNRQLATRSSYQRPWYLLRAHETYKGGKAVYQKVTSMFFINFFARTTEKLVELVADQTLSGVLGQPDREGGTLKVLEEKLLETLTSLDEKVDRSLEDTHTLDGRVLRYVASWVGWWGERTPVVGDSLVNLQHEMDPDFSKQGGRDEASTAPPSSAASSTSSEQATPVSTPSKPTSTPADLSSTSTTAPPAISSTVAAAAVVPPVAVAGSRSSSVERVESAISQGSMEANGGSSFETEEFKSEPSKSRDLSFEAASDGASEEGAHDKKKKRHGKPKRLLKGVGSRLKKALNFPKTPVHGIPEEQQSDSKPRFF